MNKFRAKIKFESDKNASYLIKAFFQDFNPDSSIVIRGNKSELEIAFQEPPMAIIDALTYCKVIELNYGKNLQEHKEEDSSPAKKIAMNVNSEQDDTDVENFEMQKHNDTISIPELDEIAKKSTSFENFAELVSKWLEMDKRQDFFKNLIIVSSEVEKLTWKELEKALSAKGFPYINYDKIWSSKQVSKKLKDYSLSILKLLKILRQYKEYSFDNTKDQPENKHTLVETRCMPEIKELENIFANVDKCSFINERVRYVLEAMGLNNLPIEDQELIVKIANNAIKKRELSYDTIFVGTDIPQDMIKLSRLIFSAFINDFMQKYGSEKVQLLTFLLELKKNILWDFEKITFEVIDK